MATLDKEIQILMLKGQRGDAGTSIDRIEKTATSGLVDTYTIYLSDGTTHQFQVTNGKDGQDGEITQSDLDSAVATLNTSINTKVNRQSTSVDGKTGNVNNMNGNVGINVGKDDNYNYFFINETSVTLEADVENVGQQSETYYANIKVKYNDIEIERYNGGSTETKSLFTGLYQHNINAYKTGLDVNFTLFNNSSLQLDFATILSMFEAGETVCASGYAKDSNNINCPLVRVYKLNAQSTTISVMYIRSDGTTYNDVINEYTTITDVVKKIY